MNVLNTKQHDCLICGQTNATVLLDCGFQPIGNIFRGEGAEHSPVFPLRLAQCGRCGQLQLADLVFPSELTSPHDWLSYNEAEGHLDAVVSRVKQIRSLSSIGSSLGVSYKDKSLLDRLIRGGSQAGRVIEPMSDLGISAPTAGLELIQGSITPDAAQRMIRVDGPYDLLLVRHIFEHSQKPREFARALRCLAEPDGLIVFEIPDVSPALEHWDYTMLWEEHQTYFTSTSFVSALSLLGFEILETLVYPYGHENSCVVIARPGVESVARSASRTDEIATHCALARRYAGAFAAVRRDVIQRLTERKRRGARIALFGAGHLSVTWLGVFGAAPYVDVVVDDHPRKVGTVMPGSGLPIVPSSELVTRGVTLCLTSLSAESEAKVRAKCGAYEASGGTFASIFPGRPNSFQMNRAGVG